MSTSFNPFAALLDPVGILNACAQSGGLEVLPVSAKRSADCVRCNVSDELAEHDAAVEEIYRQMIIKAAKASPAKPKKTERVQES